MSPLRSGRNNQRRGRGRPTERTCTPSAAGVQAPEGPEGLAVPWAMAGLAALRDDTPVHTPARQAPPVWGRWRELPRCRWAVAGPGRASRRRAERSSRRGRLAGGPPPTGTHSGRAIRRPEHQRRNTTCPVGSHDCRSATKFAQHRPSSGISAKKLAQRAIKRQFVVIFPTLGELFCVSTLFAPRRANFFALAHTRPSREKNIAPKARQHGEVETNNTTALPQQGTAETDITTAPEKCTR